jgi:soluble epoxide hydrolase / lipid-phosphate phosphatase
VLTPPRYKSAIRNIDAEREGQVPLINYTITKPVLFIGGDKDYATPIEGMLQSAKQGKHQGWLPNVKVKVVQGGSHWLMLEKPDETFALLDGFAKAL